MYFRDGGETRGGGNKTQMLIFQLKTGRLSIVTGRGLCVFPGEGRGGGAGVLSPYNLAFHGPLSAG